MGKYGKKFRKIQIAEWKEKYLNYKEYKQKIKSIIHEKNGEDYLSMNDNEKETKIGEWSFEFEDSLDKDIKKIYIFFSNKERILYKKINKLLHMKEEYLNFELGDYLEQYKELNELSLLSLNISEFIYYNLKAVMKILKKYDKKVIGPEFKHLYIKINYIQAKLEEQNSDILYLIKFKMIDEINLISENLIKSLKEQYKLNKNKLNNNIQNDLENKLIDEVPEINQAESLIRQNHETIKKNIKKIDNISAKITILFLPWKNYLRISTDINSKLLQITKENSMNDSINTLVKRSIAETINFSKESKYNILIILTHGFLYMYSYSVIIPAYTSIIINIDGNIKEKHQFYWWGLLMMMAPVGSLFSNFYETSFFKKSTKKPIIISCLGLMLGNLLYSFTPKIDCFFLLFLCRFIIGLFNLRTHNKMYLLNFLLRKDISYYLTIFHTLSMLGLGFGFLLNSVLIGKNVSNKKDNILNNLTIGSFSAGIFSFCLFILSFLLFTEAYSKYFNMTSLQMFNEGILNENGDNDDIFVETNNNTDGENIENEVRKQSVLLKGINEQLGNVNRLSAFDDTNLVVKSVYELTKREEGSLNYLFNSFVIYLLIIFTTKFINETIYLNAILFNNEEEMENLNKTAIKIPTALGCSCFISLIIELSLSCKDIFISEKHLLIILLFFLTFNNALLILLEHLNNDYFYFFIFESIIANLTQKYAAHLFLYIIPENYHLCKIHGNVLINIFSMLSMIISCSLVFFYDDPDDACKYRYIILIIMTSLSFLSLIFYFIFYQDIRVKAIRRIMKDNTKDEVKVSTEV